MIAPLDPTLAQIRVYHLAFVIASAETWLAWARAARSNLDVERIETKERVDDQRGLSAERIRADLQWRELTITTIDLHLAEMQLLHKVECWRREMIQLLLDHDLIIPDGA